ncbi:MAG: hypothetical protein U1E94_07705 [Agitococcus sp.]
MIKSLPFFSILSLVFSSTVSANDYFLTAQQKKELILSGQMHDQEQRLYDVWIVTGYVQPIRHIKQGWQQAGESLESYGKASFYQDIADASHDTWRYGTKSVLKNYTFKGTQKAWQQDMQTAKKRTEQRVFGWWLAYPWGVFEASVESIWRLGTGLPIGLGVAASAYTLVPTGGMLWPTAKSVGYATIEGTAYPVVAASWNTIIAPPLALLGQQPAPERADGFWMKQVDDPNLQVVAQIIKDWYKQLAAQQPAVVSAKQQQVEALREQLRQLEQQLQSEEKYHKQQQIAQLLQQMTIQKPLLNKQLADKGLSLAILARNRQAMKVKLSDIGLSYEDLDKVLDLLVSSSQLEQERNTDDKTDPLQRSLDILQYH